MEFPQLKRRHHFALAGLVVVLLYGAHFLSCARSPIIQFPFVYQQSDMYANLLWARSIQDQGWLNPHPYHPYNNWMQRVGTEQDWALWWGGTAIFQQSPLYAYFLSVLFWINGNVLYVHLLQSLMGVGLCILTGLIAHRVTWDPKVGWVAFWLAALYSPYYVYTWTLLRDSLGWIFTAGALLLLLETQSVGENKSKKYILMGAIGLVLGIGYLARETFLLIIPLVVLVLTIQAFRKRAYVPLIILVCSLLAALSPLVIRNYLVGAPLFSSSNRFAEGFIEGNAAGALPNQPYFPPELQPILRKSGGKAGPVIVETLKTHPNLASFLRLQTLKVLSLFDPYEPCDNMSIYFMENFSAPVKWGLRHWMVIVPGVAGLILSLGLKDQRHFWLWLMFVPLFAGVFVDAPLSRYRQSLMILWIPWAAYFLVTLWRMFFQNRRLALPLAIATVLGWTACITVFARVPKDQYERPWEYLIAISVYENAGQTDKAAAMKQLFHQKFPGLNP